VAEAVVASEPVTKAGNGRESSPGCAEEPGEHADRRGSRHSITFGRAVGGGCPNRRRGAYFAVSTT